MFKNIPFVLICLLLITDGTAVPAVPQTVDESHEVTVRLVLVDVIATDRDGNIVRDLTLDDFEITEGRKKIPLNSMDFIDFMKVQTSGPTGTKSIRKKRFFVIFDSINTISRMLNRSKDRLIEKLVELILAGGEIMVMEMEEKGGIRTLQDFTSDPLLIAEGVKKATGSIWVEHATDDLKTPVIVNRRETTDREKMPVGVGIAESAREMYEFKTRLRFEKSLSNLLSAMSMIKDYPGRKPVLLVSGGFPSLSLEKATNTTGIESRISHTDISAAKIRDPFKILQKGKTRYGDDIFEDLIQFANSHNITFYTLDPDLYLRYMLPDMANDNFVLQANLAKIKQDELFRLKYFALDTGGDALQGAGKFDQFSEHIAQDLFSYYELSYYPQRKKADGSYHKIQVNCKRPGVKIRFRKGYFDYDPAQSESLIFASSSSNPQLFKDISFDARAVPFIAGKGKYILWFTMAMPVKDLVLSSNPDKKFKVLKMNFWLDDPADRSALNATIPIPIALTREFRERLAGARFYGHNTRSDEIKIKPDAYNLIFSLYDEESGLVGTSEQLLEIPDLDSEKGARILNAVFGRLHEVKERAVSFSISERDGTLAAGNYKFYPMGVNQWERGQPIGLFLQILQEQKTPDIEPVLTLTQNGRERGIVPVRHIKSYWDKKTQVMNTAVGLDFGNVPSGKYALKISVKDPDSGKDIHKEIEISLF